MAKELLTIYALFFKMGGVTFGGGYAMLPILRREIVEKYGWLTEEQVMDFYAISQGLPGIIAINVSVFIGYSRQKTLGAVSAALGMVSPCIIIISTIAAFMSNFKDNAYVQYALGAVSVCVCALIVDAVIGMWKKGVKDIYGIILCVGVFALMVFTNISPILLVVGSAVVGIVIKSVKAGKAQ